MRWRAPTSAYHLLTTRQQRKFAAARKGLPRVERGCLPSSVVGRRIWFWTAANSGCAVAFKDAALVRVCTAHCRDPRLAQRKRTRLEES